MISSLRDAPRWIFLAALVYAPWAEGSTTADTIAGLNRMLGAALILWIFNLVLAKRRPPVPSMLVGISLALLAIGWWMAFNARWVYDSDYSLFMPIRRLFPSAPGSVDQAISVAWMVRATILLGVAWLVADLSQRPDWLLRLWWTLGIAGGSIALFGLLEKATAAPMIFWEFRIPADSTTFFAAYYYHANAGAFLNLVLPPTCGLAFRSFTRPSSPTVRALWLSAVVILLVAILANTSRMAQFIAVLLIIALVFSSSKMLFRRALSAERKIAVIGLIVVAATLFAVAQASHLDQPLGRWQSFTKQLPADSRWLVWQAALGAVHDAGWFGFGPGTFRVIFPYYTGYLGDRLHVIWLFLHEDYLQTLLEWGWMGGALWAAFFFGGIVWGIQSLRAERVFRRGAEISMRGRPFDVAQGRLKRSEAANTEWSPRYRSLLSLSVLALAGVALHALVDFPLQIASLQLYVATYLGLCWGSGMWGKSGDRKAEREK